jgi:hypothetical protein
MTSSQGVFYFSPNAIDTLKEVEDFDFDSLFSQGNYTFST